MLKTNYILPLVFIFFIACSPGAVPSSSSADKYSEDLSYLRPTYTESADTTSTTSTVSKIDKNALIDVKFDVTEELNTILDSIDVVRKDKQYIDGFTIQVYSGNDSQEATKIRGRIYSILKDSKPSLKFEEPNFKVKVGKYYSRIEAQKDYMLVKTKFASALIIPQRMSIE